MAPATEITVTRLLKHWRAARVPLNDGATAQQLAKVEQQCGVRFPDTLRSLYQAANGMPEKKTDSRFFYLWPLEQVLSESKAWAVPPSESLLLFGDFLMASHAYGVRCAGAELGSVHAFDGKRAEKVAESLASFFTALVTYPDRVRLLSER